MRLILFLILLASSTVHAQKSAVEIYRRHKFLCDDETTTVGINVCSLDRLNYVDSLMKGIYQRKLRALDKDIKANSSSHLNKTKKAFDSSKVAFFKKEKDYSTALKRLLIQSQRASIRMRELNYTVAAKVCEGGTACPVLANGIYIQDTLDRIRRLENPEFL